MTQFQFERRITPTADRRGMQNVPEIVFTGRRRDVFIAQLQRAANHIGILSAKYLAQSRFTSGL
jgi:hypothetical protein